MDRELKQFSEEKKELEAKEVKIEAEIKKLEALKGDVCTSIDSHIRTQIQQAKTLRLELHKRLLQHDREFILLQLRWAEESPQLLQTYLKYYTDKLPHNDDLAPYIDTRIHALARGQFLGLVPPYKCREVERRDCQRQRALAVLKRAEVGGEGGAKAGAMLGALGLLREGLGLRSGLPGEGEVSECVFRDRRSPSTHTEIYYLTHAYTHRDHPHPTSKQQQLPQLEIEDEAAEVEAELTEKGLPFAA